MQIDFKKIEVNPAVVFRDDFEDAAILYNPETEAAYGLNHTGVWIWKLLDGKHSQEEIIAIVNQRCISVPEGAAEHLNRFIRSLIEKGMVGYVL
ncbi:MAG: PqqD family peptide modification chaperone [candidate division Zixibacteria bacterium]|nr:PqqD family peptide modification chaperone [Candidatus Tariuqbacter arcticus]